MFGFILTKLITFAILVTLTKCQPNDAVWCPKHLQPTGDEHSPYRNCQPHHCIYRNDSNTQLDDSSHCLSYELSYVQHSIMTNESCHWVRLHKDRHFHLNHNDGSIYENKTRLTYMLGEYVYLQHLKEAIVCREQLLADDDTEDITLWCSSHTIPLNKPPQEQQDGSLYLPQLHLTVIKGLYNVHDDTKQVDVCLDMDLDFMRCQTLVEINHNTHPFHQQDDFSIVVNHKDGSKVNVLPVGHYYLSADNTTLIHCLDPVEDEILFQGHLYPVHIVSAVFLFLTLLVHLFNPKLNYHAKALVCHVFSMMVMYICLAVSVSSVYVSAETVAGRLSLEGLYYVSSMSTYLWLCIVSYDVWKVFANRHGVFVCEMNETRWFGLKCLFAWGIPLVLCLVIIGVSHVSSAAHYFGLTHVSKEARFLDSYKSMLAFFYGPITYILLMNLVFLGLTMWNMKMTFTDQRKNSKKLFYLCVKLLVVMVICGLADFISFMWFYHAEVFYWSNVISGLQGVAIFVVYVCKKSTWRMMKRRCGHAIDAISETKSCNLNTRSLLAIEIDNPEVVAPIQTPVNGSTDIEMK